MTSAMTLETLLWFVGMAFAIAQASTFCTTIYLHRCLTHTGLKLHPVLCFFMHLELALTTGIVPREWAAVHRKHHRFSDEDGDPHSPYLEGLWNVLFFNVLMYKKEIKNQETLETFTPNWQDDFLDRIPRIEKIAPILGQATLAVTFPWVTGLDFWIGAPMGYAVWWLNAGFYVLLNAMINSICHKIGYQNFPNHKATNLRWVALLTGGEGLHNNHHEFPMSARFRAKASELDLAWIFIRIFKALGLADYKESGLATTKQS